MERIEHELVIRIFGGEPKDQLKAAKDAKLELERSKILDYILLAGHAFQLEIRLVACDE